MWDYKTIKFPTSFGFLSGTEFDEVTLENELRTYGMQGWELVSIFDIDSFPHGESNYVIAVMKRRIE